MAGNEQGPDHGGQDGSSLWSAAGLFLIIFGALAVLLWLTK